MKKFSNSIMIILVVAAIFVFYEQMRPVKVDAKELTKEYSIDKNAANKKYLKKEIKVIGAVKAFYQISGGINYLQLKTDSSSVNLYCFFANKKDEDAASNLSQSDTITVSGVCVGADKYKFLPGVKIEVNRIEK